MARGKHVGTLGAGSLREAAGPAEGQYTVLEGQMGTETPGVPDETGVDDWQFTLEESCRVCIKVDNDAFSYLSAALVADAGDESDPQIIRYAMTLVPGEPLDLGCHTLPPGDYSIVIFEPSADDGNSPVAARPGHRRLVLPSRDIPLPEGETASAYTISFGSDCGVIPDLYGDEEPFEDPTCHSSSCH